MVESPWLQIGKIQLLYLWMEILENAPLFTQIFWENYEKTVTMFQKYNNIPSPSSVEPGQTMILLEEKNLEFFPRHLENTAPLFCYQINNSNDGDEDGGAGGGGECVVKTVWTGFLSLDGVWTHEF